MEIIAVVNYKGGVAKTTTAVNHGAGLARLGKRTLIVDLDAQASATTYLGFRVTTGQRSIYDALLEEKDMPVLPVEDNLWLVPSDNRLSVIEEKLSWDRKRGLRLKHLLETVEDRYDYVLLDCPPNFVIGNFSSLLAANWVLIPSTPTSLALDGVSRTLAFAERARLNNPKLRILGILFTQVEKSSSDHIAGIDWAARNFESLILKSRIRKCMAVAKSPGMNTSVFKCPRGKNGVEDYMALAKETIEIIKNHER